MFTNLNFNNVESFGGNMEALVAYVSDFRILISNGFGKTPTEGEFYIINIYKKMDSEEFNDEALDSYEGNYYYKEEAQQVATALLNKLLR